MYVVNDMRMPDVVDLVDSKLRLDLRERVPVAIVIVTYILVIKLRRLGSFIRRAERLVIPVLDDVDAVGIERWHEEDDRIIEDLPDLRFVAGCESMCDQHARQS